MHDEFAEVFKISGVVIVALVFFFIFKWEIASRFRGTKVIMDDPEEEVLLPHRASPPKPVIVRKDPGACYTCSRSIKSSAYPLRTCTYTGDLVAPGAHCAHYWPKEL